MQKRFFLFLVILLGTFLDNNISTAQSYKQTIRGKISDIETGSPLPGAVIIISSDSISKNTASGENGLFRFSEIPVGKYLVTIKYMGYKEMALKGIEVTSGKEVILNPELESSVSELAVAEITAYSKDEVVNEMTVVGSRSFSVEETQRYAGSRGDPARMASNFAGVGGSDDSRNDLIIRGNSPLGVLWRVDGVDIPNPNHFAVSGSTGGPVSILNNKVFDRSDFMTSAFPAEYGNCTAGVFDLRFRNGNNEKHEFTGQFGFLGTELTAEGPINKKKGSSYIATYRYSTLKLFESFNIKIGTSAVPNYQDASFKINFPGRKNSNLSIFGIGGKSNIDIVLSKFTEPQEELYGLNNRDQYFRTSMGVIGSTYSKQINPSTVFKATLSGSGAFQGSDHFLIYRNISYKVDSIKRKLGYNFTQYKTSLNLILTRKINNSNTIKVGMNSDQLFYSLNDSIFNESANLFNTRVDYEGGSYFLQPYIQWKNKPSDKLSMVTGIHGQYFGLNNSCSIEPRLGLKYDLNQGRSLSFGTGFHSQTQPFYIYFQRMKTTTGNFIQHNRNLDFSRSYHLVGSYDHSISSELRFKAEVYYQYLWDIPVERRISSYSIINQGTTFDRFFPGKLENKGSGENMGAEITVEKFFSKSFFLLFTTTLFNSKYKGSDGIKRNTDYNGNFISNLLAGKEFKAGKNGVFGIGGKGTWAGGKRYTPVDVPASALAGSEVYIDTLRNTLKFRDYFRLDLKISYKLNKRNLTHEIALDLVNILNNKNILGLTYSPDPLNPAANPIREEYQLGFLPLFYYKIDF